MKINELTYIDLFAGIGGFRIALDKHGAECVFTSEIDEHCIATYKDNFGGTVHGDIRKINEKKIPEHDILCAGFPCQAFSISGKQLGFDDSRGTLFFDIVRIVKERKPKILFLENVANLAKHNDSETVNLMIKTLEFLGYDVNWKVISSHCFGVPQVRKRIYFVAFRKDLCVKEFKFPEKTHDDTVIEDILEKNVDGKYVITKKIKFIKDISEKRTKEIVKIGIINKGGQGDRVYSSKGYGITLSANGGGNAAKTGAYFVNGVVRKLTPRECARMQGFPETFLINKSDNQAYKQFGNSVAIPVLDCIVEEIANSIKE